MTRQNAGAFSKQSLVKTVERMLTPYFPNGVSVDQDELKMEIVNKECPTVSFVLDLPNQVYVYVSENIKQITGFSSEDFLQGGLALGISCICPSHRKMYAEDLLPLMLQWINEIVVSKKSALGIKITYNVNILNGKGESISTLHILKPITLNEDGFPIHVAKYMVDYSHQEITTNPEIKLEYKMEGGSYVILKQKSFDLDSSLHLVLSKREREILSWVKKGLKNREIAEKLCLSFHTVCKHRKNIVKKCEVKNLHQLNL